MNSDIMAEVRKQVEISSSDEEEKNRQSFPHLQRQSSQSCVRATAVYGTPNQCK